MHSVAQRMHIAPIGQKSMFVSSPTNQGSEAARGHLVAESAERVHSSCRKRGGVWGGVAETSGQRRWVLWHAQQQCGDPMRFLLKSIMCATCEA